jgi:hypothetical protein
VKLEDKAWAMEHLLGPTLQPEGATNRLKSEEARALTEHLYTPDRCGHTVAATRGCQVGISGQLGSHQGLGKAGKRQGKPPIHHQGVYSRGRGCGVGAGM